MLRAAAKLRRVFQLPVPDAPGLVFVGGEADPALLDADLAGLPAGSLAGSGRSPQRAFESCVGEGIEYLSQFCAPATRSAFAPDRRTDRRQGCRLPGASSRRWSANVAGVDPGSPRAGCRMTRPRGSRSISVCDARRPGRTVAATGQAQHRMRRRCDICRCGLARGAGTDRARRGGVVVARRAGAGDRSPLPARRRSEGDGTACRAATGERCTAHLAAGHHQRRGNSGRRRGFGERRRPGCAVGFAARLTLADAACCGDLRDVPVGTGAGTSSRPSAHEARRCMR